MVTANAPITQRRAAKTTKFALNEQAIPIAVFKRLAKAMVGIRPYLKFKSTV